MTSSSDITPTPAPERLARLRRYAQEDISGVTGWLQVGSLAAIWSLLETQIAAGIAGDVVEIGVYHGKSFLLFANSLDAGERAIAIDPLDQAGRRQKFEDNCRVFLREEQAFALHAIPSDQFREEGRCSEFAGKVRALHIDGGHVYDAVRNDLKIALEVLSETGFVVVDDMAHPWYPDITVAVADHLREDAALTAFAMTAANTPVTNGGSKLFLARPKGAGFLRKALRSALAHNFKYERDFVGQTIDIFDFHQGVQKNPLKSQSHP
ncbi:MAG: class I SAM-dependent methyltransferase [Rhodospirillaceae bacterium]|jgi:hypothetical protein|nr:class I SAM-dependent methyltransferase [Rhodospirillaceae bacterium]MBT6139952.1 class I SAM-dependent methyltransferase [Rhodospirillaceae bacterium]